MTGDLSKCGGCGALRGIFSLNTNPTSPFFRGPVCSARFITRDPTHHPQWVSAGGCVITYPETARRKTGGGEPAGSPVDHPIPAHFHGDHDADGDNPTPPGKPLNKDGVDEERGRVGWSPNTQTPGTPPGAEQLKRQQFRGTAPSKRSPHVSISHTGQPSHRNHALAPFAAAAVALALCAALTMAMAPTMNANANNNAARRRAKARIDYASTTSTGGAGGQGGAP